MIDLSTSTYYYKPKVSRAERDKRDADLRDLIENIQVVLPKCGYRPMKKHLWRDEGLIVNHKKIRRIMAKYGLYAQIKRKFIRTTDSNHGYTETVQTVASSSL